jgi:hypothetical protein
VSVLVVLAAVVVNLFFWMVLPSPLASNESTDFASFYDPVARNLLNGKGLRLNDGSFAAKYPPGYPMVLAVVYGLGRSVHLGPDRAIAAFILCCNALTTLLLFRLSRSLWGTFSGLITATLWIGCPIVLWLNKQPNSEIPWLPLVLGSLALFWRSHRLGDRRWPLYLVVGILIGLATLIRPIAIGMGVLLVAFLVIARSQKGMRRTITYSGALLFGNILAVAPWLIYASNVTRELMPISTNGPSSIVDGLTFAVAGQVNEMINDPLVSRRVIDVQRYFLENRQRMKTLGNIAQVVEEGTGRWPIASFELWVVKLARSWYGTNTGRGETPIKVIMMLYLFLGFYACSKCWRYAGQPRQFLTLAFLLTAYFWIMTTSVLSIIRYMIVPLSLIFIVSPAAWRRGPA